MKNIDDYAPEYVVRILVGNKSDLHHRIVISTEDGKKLATKYRIDFFETSAKSEKNQTVSQIFYSVVEELLGKDLPKSEPTVKLEEPKSSLNVAYDEFVGCCATTRKTWEFGK